MPLDRYRGAGETVLVVDDIKEQRDLAAFMLKRLDYQVETVSNGQEAVAYLRTTPVDVLVLDMILEPGMDGLDTYRQVQALHPGQKTIIASGFSESAEVKKAASLGARGFIKKPYTLEELGQAIRKELAN